MLLCSYSDSSKAVWFTKCAYDRKCYTAFLGNITQLVRNNSCCKFKHHYHQDVGKMVYVHKVKSRPEEAVHQCATVGDSYATNIQGMHIILMK